MNWHSPAEFFAMGGYAAYVWGSVAACVAALLAEWVGLRGRRRAAVAQLRRELRARRLDRQEATS